MNIYIKKVKRREGISIRRKEHKWLKKGVLCVLALLVMLCAASSYSLDVPPLKGYVNDYANMISPSSIAQIEKDLKAFEDADSTQVVILTIPSLQGEALEDFSIKVAETWKIGQKGKDNGIIFLVARQERKIRVEVGRGLEGKLTDLMAGRIIDLVIKPRFKRNDFDGGFLAGVHALIDATRGEFKATNTPVVSRQKKGSPIPALGIFFAFILFTLGRVSKVLGGILGAVGFPLALVLILGLPWLVMPFLAIGGLIIGLVLPSMFSLGRRGGGGSMHGGGFFMTGGGSSWGSSGGGFSGGGGSFGGGGASGDW